MEHWDDAIPGSSALQVWLLRRILDDIEAFAGGFSATAHWNMEKFYDSAEVDVLIETAAAEAFLLDLLCLDLQSSTLSRGF